MRRFTDIDAHVAARVKERRLALGLTQRELAAVTGVTWQQHQKREAGKNRLSASALWQLAVFMGVPVGWFFDGLEAGL